jgi:hypothetical protein
MNISTDSPVFYANHLRVLSVVGDRIRVQFSFYWDTKDLKADYTIDDLLLLGGEFSVKLVDRFGMIPDQEVIEQFLMENQEDLDWFLADDCNTLVSKSIQEQIRAALDQIA